MAEREKKERKTKIQKFEYLENEKSFLDEIRNIFHSFLTAIIWWKIKFGKKQQTQALSKNPWIDVIWTKRVVYSKILVFLQDNIFTKYNISALTISAISFLFFALYKLSMETCCFLLWLTYCQKLFVLVLAWSLIFLSFPLTNFFVKCLSWLLIFLKSV